MIMWLLSPGPFWNRKRMCRSLTQSGGDGNRMGYSRFTTYGELLALYRRCQERRCHFCSIEWCVHPVWQGWCLGELCRDFFFLKPFFDIEIQEWNKVMETNLTGIFLVTKYVCRVMMNQKRGRIVNISCIRSRILRKNMADYAAAKGGVIALTSAMALDLAPYNIRVNSVAPGFTRTGMTMLRLIILIYENNRRL